MKLFGCPVCGSVDALKRYARKCPCGESGGQYNNDGDTATVWGRAFLLGLNNVWVWEAAKGHHLPDIRDEVLWPYPMDNGKITVLAEAPTS